MTDNEFDKLSFTQLCDQTMKLIAKNIEIEQQNIRLFAQNERLCEENTQLRNERAAALRASVETRIGVN